MLPQQTTILGFLRYEALRKSGLLGNYSTEWNSLIGTKSFDGSNEQKFGIIKNVSPVSIYNGNNDFYPLRDPINMNTHTFHNVKVSFGDNSEDWDELNIFQFGEANRYDPKNHSHFKLIFSDFNGNSHPAECDDVLDSEQEYGFILANWSSGGIFRKDTRPGITKSYKGTPNDEGFFETEFWRMHPDFAYSFTADIDDHNLLKASDWKDTIDIIRFGGDRSIYRLSVTDGITNTEGNSGTVFILMSDAKADNSIYNHCATVVTDTQHFRNMRTQSKANENWNKRPADFNSLKQNGSNAQVLLKHGSILIAKNDNLATELAKALSSNYAFRNIGYNHFQRLNQIPKGLIK
ncbi:MAG: hypothetical protein IPM92_02695 [Saprospiraceae bacterium]|nr:hypothetical protein [Saprospiraceae bacterium]